MGQKRHRYTRDWMGWKCVKCGVEAFPTAQQFYRHWDRVHQDAESCSEGSIATSSGLDATSGSSVSSAAHSGAPPGDGQRSEMCSDQPSGGGCSCDAGGGADGMQAQQDEGVVAAALEPAVASSPGCHPGPDVGAAEVPEHLDADLFYDPVCPSLLSVAAPVLAHVACQCFHAFTEHMVRPFA